MGSMGSGKSGRRVRRQFTDEFMAGAVRLVLDEGKTIGAVARELDLTPSSLANWVRQTRQRGSADLAAALTGKTAASPDVLTSAACWDPSHLRACLGASQRALAADGHIR
jgi:transposase-like protein